MKLKVNSSVGAQRSTDIDADPKENVGTVKKRIANVQICDENGIDLHWNGKALNDDARLKEYGIKEGDTISVLPKDLAGAGEEYLPLQVLYERLSSEWQEIKRSGIPLHPSPTDPLLWHGFIYGKGKWNGRYEIMIQVLRCYSRCPPIVTWLTPMNPPHPNIYSTGVVCLSILNNSKGEWKEGYSLITVYKSLEWLVRNPNYERPVAGLTHGFLGGVLNAVRNFR